MLLVTTALLTTLGIVMVLSASSVDSYTHTGSAFSVFNKQLMWLAIGLPAFWLGLKLRPKVFRTLAYPALIVSFLLLAAVLVPGVGTEVNGGRRWIEFGPLQLQPSEPAKLALALWGADLLVRKQKLITDWRHLVFPLLPVAVAMCGLVMLEPDLGTTLCFVLVLFALLWTVGAPARLFVILGGLAISAVVALIIIEPYRMARVTRFLEPAPIEPGQWDQASQGLSALSSGGWFGVGLGQSRLKWGLLPNAHTDYIFAILGEELGLVGCLVVLGLFAVLAYSGLRIAHRTADPFVRLVCGAVVVWLSGQAMINIGYVTGMLPVTGIPLPLISFGGTSLVLTLFVLGMMCSFARHEPAAAAAIRAGGESRIARWLRLPVPQPERRRGARTRTRAARRPATPARRTTAQTSSARRTKATATTRQNLRPTGTEGRRR